MPERVNPEDREEPQVAPEEPQEPETVETPKTRRRKRKDPAAELVKKKREREMEKAEEQRKIAHSLFVFYLKCPRVADHIAAFLTEDPPRVLTPDHWYSTYHKVGDPVVEPIIYCQECALDGEARRWAVSELRAIKGDNGIDFLMTSITRKVCVGQISREEYEAKLSDFAEAVGEEVI